MIGKAKSVSHGANLLRYISGESLKKGHERDRITRIADNGLDGLCASAMWESIKLQCSGHGKMSNSVIRFELSPELNDTRNFTAKDWQDLWEEYLKVFDDIVLKSRDGKVISPKTNLRNSKFTVWLHEDSESGIPHLHAAVCRVDDEGFTNNDSMVKIRAIRAADIVSRRRGWSVAFDIHEQRIPNVSAICMDVLREMPKWSWSDYAARLKSKGWTVCERRDGNGTLKGYSLKRGNIRYKASDLGKGRNLMVKNLEKTWRKLHTPVATKPQSASKPVATPVVAPAAKASPRRVPDFRSYQRYHDGYIPCHVSHSGNDYLFYIPSSVHRLFDDVFDFREFVNSTDLVDKSIALFVGLILPPEDVNTSVGSGSSSNDKDWGRDPKEDEIEWAKRCARAAQCMTKPIRKSGRHR